MSHFTPEEMIAHAKAWIAADAHRMASRPDGYPKAAWREANPISLPNSFEAEDLNYKTRPSRVLSFDCNGTPYDLWVWRLGKSPQCIERINLRGPDASERLARYYSKESK